MSAVERVWPSRMRSVIAVGAVFVVIGVSFYLTIKIISINQINIKVTTIFHFNYLDGFLKVFACKGVM